MPRPLASLVTLVLFMAAGCGGIAPESQAPAAPAAEPSESMQQGQPTGAAARPETLEEAESALARAQAELDSALGPVAFAQPPPAAAPAPAAAPERAADSAQESASAPAATEGRTQKKGAGSAPNCDLACRAFGSLERAAQAVCRIDGDGGERCGRARKVLTDAQSRVSGCSCARP